MNQPRKRFKEKTAKKKQIGNNLENKKWLQLEGIKQKNIEH